MKIKFLNICYAANIALVLIVILLPISYLTQGDVVLGLLNTSLGLTLRGVLLLFAVIMWVYCITIWAKEDRKLLHLFLLLFLSSFYIIYYYYKIINRGWR